MTHRRMRVTTFLTVLASGWTAVPAADIPDVMNAIATRLDQKQIKQGVEAGNWDKDWGYNGSIVAGMVDAFACTQKERYRTSAVLGGQYILWEVRCDAFMGDEMYALHRVSLIDDGPEADQWETVIHRFFDVEVGDLPEDLRRYTEIFEDIDPATAVFYLAYFTVAAYETGAGGAPYWREALVEYLARVGDDQASFPVMALGVATWALAQTGPLDDALIGDYDRHPYWKGKHLHDLPTLLAGHQVPEGQPYSGSFYWRFDHRFGPFPGPLSGYTEDTIYGTMGLLAVASLEENEASCEMEEAIRAAAAVLVAGVDPDGKIYEHLAREGRSYYAFGGEMLQVLCAVNGYLESRSAPEPDEECPRLCGDDSGAAQ